jgi:hypothetical protein
MFSVDSTCCGPMFNMTKLVIYQPWTLMPVLLCLACLFKEHATAPLFLVDGMMSYVDAYVFISTSCWH